MTAIRLQKSLVSKAIVYTFIFVLLIGVLITKSRAGFMALVGTFVLMAFLGKGKKVAWFIIIAAVIIVISFPVMREAFQERVVRIYDPTTGQWGRNIVARVEIWKRFFGTITPQVFIFGQGAVQAAIRTGGTSHSAYVSLIALYGLGGVVWALIALIIFFRKTFAARHAANPLLSTISAGCIWAILAWGIYGLSADALSSNYPRYLLFYLVVLIDRASYFAGQEQLSWLYDEREEYVEEEYCVYAP
jgi:hypothetical protein